jgi:hypothetical protein
MRPKRWMGRTEFRTWNDCERALVGHGTFSARAKWRALRSAWTSTLEMNLTQPTLLEMGIFHRRSARIPAISSACIDLLMSPT